MVPLGAMWGNDPQIDSTASPTQPLTQNWINPAAPAYVKMTLGWGGRLSGPNDAAVNDAVIDGAVPIVTPNLPSSSCMSCHSVAEWPMKSFLLPTSSDPQQFAPTGFVNSDYLVMLPPGSMALRRQANREWRLQRLSRPALPPLGLGHSREQLFRSVRIGSVSALQLQRCEAPTPARDGLKSVLSALFRAAQEARRSAVSPVPPTSPSDGFPWFQLGR